MYDGNTMQLKSSFVHSDIIDEVLYGNIQGQDVYYHQDGLNSVKKLTDSTGTVVASYDYDAWGNLTTTLPSIANPFTYTGREWDKETGLYYYRARYYDAKVGRFISKDPIGLAGGINQFAYVYNNPINLIDPEGEIPPAVGAVVCLIAVGIGFVNWFVWVTRPRRRCKDEEGPCLQAPPQKEPKVGSRPIERKPGPPPRSPVPPIMRGR